ncbi:MAG TPA: formate dehydrogenase accessory sulfurtransferase FdhD [Longimicrobiales bacterium]|nr:formate dehydrogenase accessory sulfurtransferase FdhD [Longimicrobiales bacterium]
MPKRAAAVEEVPVAIEVAGRREAALRATPEALEELAAGHLRVAGRIRSAADISEITVAALPRGPVPESVLVRVTLAPGAPPHDPGHPGTLEHVLSCDACAPTLSRGAGAPPAADRFGALLEELYARSQRYGDTGGVHAAGLSDGERLLFPFEDVGRHNAVDKAIGGALLADAPLRELGLVLSARISGEIAFKAARAGLAWVASRSLPTTLAVAVAERAGLPLVARAGRTPTLFP